MNDMKALALRLSLALTLIILCGCVSSSSHILVGTQRPPIQPSQVKLYLHPPANYEEVALLSADSRNSFATREQAKMDAAIDNLKAEAAKLGANGIVLNLAGDQYAGSFGHGVGFATGNAGFGMGNAGLGGFSGLTTFFWTGSSFSSPVFNKLAAGLAIYVMPK